MSKTERKDRIGSGLRVSEGTDAELYKDLLSPPSLLKYFPDPEKFVTHSSFNWSLSQHTHTSICLNDLINKCSTICFK